MKRYKKTDFIRRLKNAWNGISIAFIEEKNLRIQFLVFLLVLILSFYFKVHIHEFLIIILLSCLVFVVELLNTTIENICDKITFDEDSQIKKIKDISAGAVLVISFFTIVIGLIIFLLYLSLYVYL